MSRPGVSPIMYHAGSYASQEPSSVGEEVDESSQLPMTNSAAVVQPSLGSMSNQGIYDPRIATVPKENSKFKFITERGASTYKSAAERRTVRSHAMQDKRNAKRRLEPRPAHVPVLKIPLEVPQSFMYNNEQSPATVSDMNLTLNSTTPPPQSLQRFHRILSPNEPQNTDKLTEDTERQHDYWIDRSYGFFVDSFGGGRRNLLFSFPIEMNLRKHELMDHVFNDKLCRESFYDAWKATLSDPAFLYQLFYWSALHMRWLRNPHEKEEPHEAVNYYTHAVSFVQKRVQDSREAISDITIRLVIMLLFYNCCIDSIQDCKIHLNGLQEIIKLRGGIATLSSNRGVRYLLSRVDVAASVQRDAPTSFPLPEGLSNLHSLDIEVDSPSALWEWNSVFANDDQFSCIFHYIRLVSSKIEANNSPLLPEGQRWPPSTLNHRYVAPIISMLLENQKHMKKDDVFFARYESLRLGAILYLAEVRQSLGVFPIWTSVQLRKLEALIFGKHDQLHCESFKLPRLWIVAFAALEAPGDRQKMKFEDELISSLWSMGINSYEQLEEVMKSFLFIKSVHGTKLKILYTSAIPRQFL